MQRRLKIAIAICLMTSLISGCAPELQWLSDELKPTPAPVFSGCGHFERFRPDVGFETRWTRGEKLQAVIFNDKLCADCPGPLSCDPTNSTRREIAR